MTGNHVFSPRQMKILSTFWSLNTVWSSFSFFIILLSLNIVALKYKRGDTTIHEPWPSSGERAHSTCMLEIILHTQCPLLQLFISVLLPKLVCAHVKICKICNTLRTGYFSPDHLRLLKTHSLLCVWWCWLNSRKSTTAGKINHSKDFFMHARSPCNLEFS